jgi:3D (Asp-Asp-Asp) domain-containing protein
VIERRRSHIIVLATIAQILAILAQMNATHPSPQTYEITAYTSGYESTGKHPGDRGYGITSSGTRVSEGRTVACAKSIPSGSRVTIPEVGATYVCEDTGAAITDGHVDIYMNSVKRARDFGRRKMNVIIDEKGAD